MWGSDKDLSGKGKSKVEKNVKILGQLLCCLNYLPELFNQINF